MRRHARSKSQPHPLFFAHLNYASAEFIHIFYTYQIISVNYNEAGMGRSREMRLSPCLDSCSTDNKAIVVIVVTFSLCSIRGLSLPPLTEPPCLQHQQRQSLHNQPTPISRKHHRPNNLNFQRHRLKQLAELDPLTRRLIFVNDPLNLKISSPARRLLGGCLCLRLLRMLRIEEKG
jgi:hypothetical protein